VPAALEEHLPKQAERTIPLDQLVKDLGLKVDFHQASGTQFSELDRQH